MKRAFHGAAVLLAMPLVGASAAPVGADAEAPPIVESVRIWNGAPHCAFGDLIRWNNAFYCTFREGSGHVPGANGTIRILRSDDGEAWSSVASLAEEGIDLRDPKLSVMPDGRLILDCGGSDYSDGLQEQHTRVAFSADGVTWTPTRRARGIPSNNWFFRMTWRDGVGYCIPHIVGADPETGRVLKTPRRMVLFTTTDGLNYTQVGGDLPLPEDVSEATIRFSGGGEAVVIVRDGSQSRKGYLLTAPPPYTDWTVATIEHGMGGANLFALSDGSWIVGTREYEWERPAGRSGTAMVILRVEEDGSFERLVELPSGGDTSYPGFLIHEEELWVSYYSSHEDSTAIHLARIPLSMLR